MNTKLNKLRRSNFFALMLLITYKSLFSMSMFLIFSSIGFAQTQSKPLPEQPTAIDQETATRIILEREKLIREGMVVPRFIGPPPKPFRSTDDGRFPNWTGTNLRLNPTFPPQVTKTERAFLSLISRNDPRPKDRLDHFQWIERTVPYIHGNAKIVGWTGMVLSITPSGEDTFQIKIVIRPRVFSPTEQVCVLDEVIERYEMKRRHIKLIDSDAKKEKPEFQGFRQFLREEKGTF